MNIIDLITSAVLAAVCIYYGYQTNLDFENHPYANVAVGFVFVHALIVLFRSLQECADEGSKAYGFSQNAVDIIPLALTNMDLWNTDDKNKALTHALSFLPLIYDSLGKISEDCDDTMTNVKELTVLLNIATMAYYAYDKEKNLVYGMAGAAFVSHFGSMILEMFMCGFGGYLYTAGMAAFVGLLTQHLSPSE